MATARDLITDSLLWLGVNDAIDPVSAADSAMGLRWLNKLTASLQNNALIQSAITRTVWDLVSGTASYTVGTGGAVSVARPVNLTGPGERVALLDTTQSPLTEIGLVLMTDAEYAGLVQKTLAGSYPRGAYYNSTLSSASGFGTLTFWPVPNVSTLDGVLYSRTPIGSFTLNTDLVLAPGVEAMLETKLALWLAPTFGKTPSAELKDAARETEAAVTAANTRISDLLIDPAFTPFRATSNFYIGP